ncbi:MAG TPA: PTS sugar transporter subunit IIA [Phycisphaerae bacterium]|jgi:mannitol/fructose-specific phosphotransferase system IIA component (Ntr-type)|nr:PTS sugar transporter subunit IIA [Phycisphaerae bacterium]HOB76186.1 PTS sugar transporter subunit IIA [Phycisphaerae bacterium]HOJ54575.1 PTS sugar transporter subunit IIA [Phycisphaerae bacterium]HOL27032.1 PTS sugar transporter subunit IIA [Phycisphaerae bacterium]HPP22816.1 PTS sugar transporter subunit IIA [Phycisphaerae bacterium]
MKLSELVVADAIIPELASTDRNGVIREMVNALAAAMGMSEEDANAISKSVIARENQGSTGFGKGVAVPHVKHPAIKRIAATIARSSAGVDFAALDRAPVYIVVLLLSPPDNPDQHLASMENIFRHLQRDNFRRFLRQATTKEEIIDLIHEADEFPGG